MTDTAEYPRPKNRRLHHSVYSEVGRPCFITVRCAPGTQPFSQSKLADHAMNLLLAMQEAYGCRVEVFCFMPDHLHVVVTAVRPGASTLKYIDRFKGRCGFVLRKMGWGGPLWQPRSYDHVLRHDESLQGIAAYILANPVRKGLCREPSEYRWSGIPVHEPNE